MMLAKKVTGEHLLRLALLLTLLKVPNDLETETQQLMTGLHISNGTWSAEDEPRTLITPRHVHPKSIDHSLLEYERQIFDELNSLGRYSRLTSPVLHTYLLNVATDNAAPAPETDVTNVVTNVVTIADSHNATDIFDDIPTRQFDVNEFFAQPIMPEAVKREPDDSDNAQDEFVPFFAKSEYDDDVYDQNVADLRDFGGGDYAEVDYLDVKQHDNLERYLLENTPLDGEVYDISPLFSEVVVKRERASTSFTSASSSGVSEMDDATVKLEPEDSRSGDELTQEDMDLIEVLWKQDVDMGFSLEDPIPMGAPQATKVEFEDAIDKELKAAEEKIKSEELQKLEEVKASLLKQKSKEDVDDPWAGLSYTVDTETGEYVLQGDLPRELVSNDESRFDLLEEALQLVELGDEGRATPKDEEESPVDREEVGPSMLHPAMGRHPLPHHHPLAHYHNQSLMRSMSVEQRWQDLASLLTIPPPPDQYGYHHHHNIGPHGHAASYAPNYGPMAPPPDKHPEAYGAAAPIDSSYKLESAHHSQQHEPMYYQQNGTGEMGNSDGFLQSILNDEDLQLMDMAMNEGMYTMRMLEGSAGNGNAHQHPGPHLNHTHMIVNERDSASDSAVSSMGSERVPSLSDGEWCDAGSDSAQEYHSNKFRPYDASFGRERSAPGGSQPPQKKHHMFGKRCFQEPPASNLDPIVPEPPRPQTVIKYEYPEQTQHAYHQDTPMPITNVEYAPRHPHHPHIPALHTPLDLNATAHSSHALIQHTSLPPNAPPRYSYATPERVRHNHTYSAPIATTEPRLAHRDKRIRRVTDDSVSDGGTSGSPHHLSRDEKRAKALGIPLEVHDIINLPMDEFNERLSKHDLSEAQLSLIRDIRRRGKNKVAAQNCRKRKLDQITSLADEVRTVRDRKIRTQREHQTLMAERQRIKERFAALYRHVFQNLRDADGRPLSSQQYSLQQAADGNVVLVPKMTQNLDHPMNRSSDDEMERKAKHYEQ